eukprot:s2869_g6.t1
MPQDLTSRSGDLGRQKRWLPPAISVDFSRFLGPVGHAMAYQGSRCILLQMVIRCRVPTFYSSARICSKGRISDLFLCGILRPEVASY